MFKARRLWYHSTLGSRVIERRDREGGGEGSLGGGGGLHHYQGGCGLRPRWTDSWQGLEDGQSVESTLYGKVELGNTRGFAVGADAAVLNLVQREHLPPDPAHHPSFRVETGCRA